MGGCVSLEIRKFCRERCVCASHKRSFGAVIYPNVSRSILVLSIIVPSMS
ncbi:hypothetical protein P3T23_006954 [Paraburkholderia sp. GAS448]